jgi:hypothetical protein
MDEYENDKTSPQQPQIDDDNLVITTTKKIDDLVAKLVNIIITLANFIVELEQISTYLVKQQRMKG